MIGGESVATAVWVSNVTYMGQMAKKYGALAVVLEHRYYGKSMPTPDLSTQNLKYLSSNKWVVFGGSYAGNLAAWFREKYPNIAVGAIASSAPVRAAVDAMEYLGVTSESLGKECSENIRKASLEFEELLKTPEGVIKLRKILHLCDTFDGKNINNNHYLAEQMMWTVVGKATSDDSIKNVGKIMSDPSVGTPLERYSKVTEMIGSSICHDYHYSDRIAPLKNTTIDLVNFEMMRQWIYQTCTEFGYYQSSDLPNSPFGHNIPVEYFTQQCAQVYGPEFTPQSIQKAVDRTNVYYGALKPNVTNVVLPNGSLDPWHSLGILKDLNNSTIAVIIKGGRHCEDMYASTTSDSENDSNHKTGGPVFLMIGGEGMAFPALVSNATYMGEMAKKYGALAVLLEHRYYGKSIPTPDLSTQNLKYLSSEMALKDTQQFALYLSKKLSLEGNKWVVFGGSYAGNLAAWFREKYPSIAVGAIASSAPVLAAVDNMGYLGVTSESLGKKCSDNIRKAHIEMEELLKTPEGVIKLRKTLHLCDNFDGKNVNNNHYLAEEMMFTTVGNAMSKTGVDMVRGIMNDTSVGTPLERYAKACDMSDSTICHDFRYEDRIAPLKNTTRDPMGFQMMRQWTYQTCTEFGYYQSSDLPNSPFGHNIPVEYFTQQCAQVYGPEFTPQTIQEAVDRTNAYYGGLKPNVTNVMFPNGSLDPWHALSVLKDLNNSTKTVMISGGKYSHCGDIYASTPSDSEIDHFNKQDNRTFKQRYYVDDSHHKIGGPVFLMIGGEGEADTSRLSNATYMGQMTKKYSALAVVLEHRYYGKSMPTPDLSTQNLKYLSSEMALKDTQQFALYLMKKLSIGGSKWVVFGGSYAGNLAAWFREKYPNIAVGAIASSAPVRAAVDAMEYLGVTSESLGKECSENIRKASLEMEELLKSSEGVIKLRKTLHLCDTFDGKNVNNNHYLAEQMMWTIVGNAMSKTGVDKIRGIMNDTLIGTPLERYAKASGMIGSSICHDFHYEDRIAPLKKITIDPTDWAFMRQWIYQTCTEFGYYQSSDLPYSPFGHSIPVEHYTQQCAQVYGPQFTPQSIQKAVDRTNAYYGALKPNVTNVVFPNGSLDPWHSLGILKDLNNSTKAVMIEGGGHCGDMWASNPYDSESVKSAHKLIDQQIGEYLK
ncbi:unnamed protein product [Medioppia subpectinata]|uniref:Uncharacterized protein n=1 Tax=Medioppia subpectinata TaxID=1979941 RepID=A0A7R9KE96_9ACAR|nr:unnamed protein product [Medioppia subpectinata]CAG2100981.1 unnamed protein product [Medioppia subpectinata]